MLERGPVHGNAGSAARRRLCGEEAVGHTVGTITEALLSSSQHLLSGSRGKCKRLITK